MIRRFLPTVFFLLLALVASDGGARAGDALPLRATPVPLDAQDAARTGIGSLVYRGGVVLESSDRRFGGWSDLAVSPDGTRLTAISDRGHWLRAGLHYDPAGRLLSLAEPVLGPLIDTAGRPLHGLVMTDAEGLAAYPDGSFLVSFERQHRLWLYPVATPPFSQPPRPLPPLPRLDRLPDNGGIESVVRLSGGRLLALAEDFVEHGNHVGWIGDGLKWEELRYRAAPDFRPVGLAEFPPGTFAAGDILVLERRLTFLDGPGARIVRLRRADIRAGAQLEGQELAMMRLPLTLDNFEGIAIARSGSGAARLYLLSDDNYSILQRTLLLMFELAAK